MDETGVEHTESIDLVMQHGETGQFLLIMIESREWDGSHDRLVQLQDKLNTYLTYALEGQFHGEHPEAEGEKIRIHLDCEFPPDAVSMGFLDAAREAIAEHNIEFSWSLIGDDEPDDA
ncbi:MAG: DUF6572 domain-containing protein [Planctomycetota bacterium]|jgi:hypothetical protein